MRDKKYGFDFKLELENIKDDESLKQGIGMGIQEIINDTPFPITNVGVWNDTNNLAIEGQVCRFTRKEAEAEYTIFKEKLLIFLKHYNKKVKLIDRMKLYFHTTN